MKKKAQETKYTSCALFFFLIRSISSAAMSLVEHNSLPNIQQNDTKIKFPVGWF